MSTKSTPLYLGDELRARAEEAARAEGVSLSSWVREAIGERLERQSRIADGLAALSEWDAAEGPIPPELLDQAHDELRQAGVLPTRRSA